MTYLFIFITHLFILLFVPHSWFNIILCVILFLFSLSWLSTCQKVNVSDAHMDMEYNLCFYN